MHPLVHLAQQQQRSMLGEEDGPQHAENNPRFWAPLVPIALVVVIGVPLMIVGASRTYKSLVE